MSKSLTKMKTLVPVPGYGMPDSYITSAYSLPVLSADEERALALRYYHHNDIEAARKLVMHNLRFVVQVARGYSGYGLPMNDLVQEGSVGLMKAVKKFNPEVGVRLISFAVYWIRAEIHEFILQNWRIVKVATTKAQRKLFFNLRSMKKRLAWLNHKEVNEVADQLGVKPEEVTEMEVRLSGQDIGFDPLPNGEDDEYISPATCLPSIEATPEDVAEQADWQQHCRSSLRKVINELDARSLDILKARRLNDKKKTLKELSKKYGLSMERIRQIENNAVQKLRELTSH